MRTTLTLDPDVADRVREEIRRGRKGMKAVINEALRRGLGMLDKPKELEPFQVQAHSFRMRPGIDPDRMNQLVDELEALEAVKKLKP